MLKFFKCCNKRLSGQINPPPAKFGASLKKKKQKKMPSPWKIIVLLPNLLFLPILLLPPHSRLPQFPLKPKEKLQIFQDPKTNKKKRKTKEKLKNTERLKHPKGKTPNTNF